MSVRKGPAGGQPSSPKLPWLPSSAPPPSAEKLYLVTFTKREEPETTDADGYFSVTGIFVNAIDKENAKDKAQKKYQLMRKDDVDVFECSPTSDEIVIASTALG